MSYPVYTVPAGDVLPIFFDTFDGGTGASITMTGLAVTDIEIYKDGSVTQRASDAGYTLLDTDGIDFDGVTGIHGFSIDTGDNTDAGFYTVGSWFHVVVSTITVDAQTVSFVAAAFRIMAAENAAGVPAVDATYISGDATAANNAELAFDGTGYGFTNCTMPTVTTLTGHTAQTGDCYARLGAPAGASVSADIAAVKSETAAIVDDTGTSGVTVQEIKASALADLFNTDSGTTYAAAVAGSPVKEIADNAGGSALTEAGIADAVWDELLSGHVGAGSSGKAVADILVDTAEIGAAGAGLTALASAANLATVDTVVDAIKLVTDNLPDSGALTTIGTGVAAIEVDTQDIQSRIPAALTAGGNIKADALAIQGNTTAATNLRQGALGSVTFTVGAGSTTTVIETGLTEATDDHYIGRVVIFLTGALAGQASDVTDYDGTAKQLTVTALTDAPANGDTAVMV